MRRTTGPEMEEIAEESRDRRSRERLLNDGRCQLRLGRLDGERW